MKLTTILFDLDGTLLPMDNDAFTKGYFKLLAGKLAPCGYEPKQLVDAVWAGTAAMVRNDGTRTNEEAFWTKFTGVFGEKALEDKPLFDAFYAEDFHAAQGFCGFNPQAAIAVHSVKERGLRVALATNLIFPAVATESRIRWAGLETLSCIPAMKTSACASQTPTTIWRSPGGLASSRSSALWSETM